MECIKAVVLVSSVLIYIRKVNSGINHVYIPVNIEWIRNSSAIMFIVDLQQSN